MYKEESIVHSFIFTFVILFPLISVHLVLSETSYPNSDSEHAYFPHKTLSYVIGNQRDYD